MHYRRPYGRIFDLVSSRATTIQGMLGTTSALSPDMKTIMSRFRNVALLGTALIVPIAMAPTALRAQEHMNARTYHDKEHNDDHAWNNREDQAYRVWAKENHRKYSDFSKLKDNDQQSYWGWRHQHSDEVLKIKIR
jgi:type III secretory pathway component EscR